MTRNTPFRILIIEDNVPDIELLGFMLRKSGVPTELHFVKNGIEAEDFLHRRNGFEKKPVPELILLDLNIPLKDGRELLKDFKKNSEFCKIPIVMVTTSSSDREIDDCYCLGANAFISKPVDIEDYQKVINRLMDFWFNCVKLPTRPECH